MDFGFGKLVWYGAEMAAEKVNKSGGIKSMLQEWYIKRWKYSKRKVPVDNYAQFVLNLSERFYSTKEIHGKCEVIAMRGGGTH